MRRTVQENLEVQQAKKIIGRLPPNALQRYGIKRLDRIVAYLMEREDRVRGE